MPPHAAARGSVADMRAMAVVGLGILGLAVSLPERSALAQVPGVSREELVRKWDLNRDGKLDASEVEIARTKMRKLRGEAAMKSGIDPLTGRPQLPGDMATGRAVPIDETRGPDASDLGRIPGDDARDEEGLILVPGTGERPPAAAKDPMTLLPKRLPKPSAAQDRSALPGTRAPLPPSTLPAGAGPAGAGATGAAPSGAAPSGAARGPSAAQPNEAELRRAADPATRPGVIAGGMRAGLPSGRPGTGRDTGAAPNLRQTGRQTTGIEIGGRRLAGARATGREASAHATGDDTRPRRGV
ncbi:MAG: hypothetical protein ACKOTB_15680, partial [Planctomycetia bacterium]